MRKCIVSKKKPIVGVLCFDLSIASTSMMIPLAKKATGYTVKAFPIFGPPPRESLPFEYHPSQATRKGFAFNTPDGKSPEVMIRNIGWSVVQALIREADIIMLLGIQAMPAFLATVLGRFYRKPIVAVNQTMSPAIEKRRSLLIRLPKSIILRLATICVAETPITRATLCEIYKIPPDRIVDALYTGGAIDFEKILGRYSTMSKVDFRSEWEIHEEIYVVTFVGDLFFLKGVDVLIHAFAELVKTYPMSLLLIIGPDSQPVGKRDELKRQSESLGLGDHVRFLGGRSREELARLYLASDVFVLPTRKDTWSKVLVEAALAGLPLVTTEVCGSAGIMVRNGVNGFIAKVDDVQELSATLAKLADPGLRLVMGRASRKIASEYTNTAFESVGYDEAILKIIN
jgi:glycosyltransferase involved in cell wall biosynthesis